MKNKNIQRLAVSSLLTLFAGSAMAVSFNEVLEASRLKDPAFRAAQAERDAQKQDYKLGLSNLLPTLSASTQDGKGNYDRVLTSPVGPSNSTNSQVDVRSRSLQLRQPLFSLDGLARYRYGAASAEQAELNFKKQELDFLVRTLTAYIDVLSALDQVSLAEAQAAALAEQLVVALQQQKGGDATKLDVLESMAKSDLAKAQLLDAQQILEANVRLLESQSGLTVASIAPLPEDFVPTSFNVKGFEEVKALALEINLEINAARKNVELAGHEVDRAFAGHAPRVDFVAARSRSENDSVNTLNQKVDSSTYLVQVQIPLFAGFGVTAQTDKNVQLLEKAKAELDAVIQKVIIELRKQYLASNVSTNKALAYKRAVESASEAVKAARLGLKTGLRIQLDALNAEQQLYQTRLEYSKARYDSILAAIKLKITAGALESDDLQQLNSIFGQNKVQLAIPRLSFNP